MPELAANKYANRAVYTNGKARNAKISVRKYLEDEDAGFIEESSPAVSYATVFANRINFNESTDEIRYGDAHVERFFLRGVQPHYIDAFPLFGIAPGRFNPWGTVISVYFLVTGITGLSILGVSNFVQDLFYGGALVIAVTLSQIVRGREERLS